MDEADYKKRYTLDDKKKTFKKEYQSSREALNEFSPFQWKKQMKYIANLTPEEYETVLQNIDDWKSRSYLWSGVFGGLLVGFTYWQRIFLPKPFYIFSAVTGVALGMTFAAIQTGKTAIEDLDKLGKEYELSRLVKQDIFDTRDDLDSGMRAYYYMQQAKRNEKIEKQIEEMKATRELK